MSNEENRDVRKVSIINIQIDEITLPHILTRTREVDSELKLLVYKKLIKDQIHLVKLKLADIYKMVYDGLYSREEGVREQCISYLKAVYNLFYKEDKKENDREANLETLSAVQKKELYNKTRIEIRRFLGIFEIHRTLKHPYIYDLMEKVAQVMIKNIIEPDHMSNFLKEFIRIECKQGKFINIKPEETFFIRIACQYLQANSKDNQSLYNIIEDNFPSVAEYTKMLEKAFHTKDLFSVYQMVLISGLMINCDETGRHALTGTLKSFCLDFEHELKVDEDDDNPMVDENEVRIEDEYNDIYTKKQGETLNIEIYSSSYFDRPIIRNNDDLTQVIIRILRSLLDDRNNAYSNFILETIAEIKEPIEKSIEGDKNDFFSQRENITKHIDEIENNIKEIQDKIEEFNKENKVKSHKNTGTNEISKLEKLAEKKKEELENYQQRHDELTSKIENISMRCLNIACGLLQTCKFDLNDPGIMGLLSSFIGPCFQNSTPKIKDLAFKCLSLYVLLDKKFCIEYMKVYKEILDDDGSSSNSLPLLLTAIKAVFDFFLYHNLMKQEDLIFESNDDGTFDCSDLIEKITKLMFTGDSATKKVCIEGFTRLIFNQRDKNPLEILSLLMIIWINTMKNTTSEIPQLLTMFFRAYAKYSRKGLDVFEKALEIYINFSVEIWQSRELEFNNDIIMQVCSEELIHNVCKIGVDLLTSSSKKEDNDDDELTPVEKFLVYLYHSSLKESKNFKIYREILEKAVLNINFEELNYKKKCVIGDYNRRLCEEIAEIRSSSTKNIFEEIKKKIVLNEKSDEEEVKSSVKERNDEINHSKNEAHTMIKCLKEYNLLIKTSNKIVEDVEKSIEPKIKKQSKRKLNRRKKEKNENFDESDEEKKEITNKKKNSKGRNIDNQHQNPEEIKPPTLQRKRVQREAASKATLLLKKQEHEAVEEEEEEEVEEEVEEDDDDEDEDENQEEDEEEGKLQVFIEEVEDEEVESGGVEFAETDNSHIKYKQNKDEKNVLEADLKHRNTRSKGREISSEKKNLKNKKQNSASKSKKDKENQKLNEESLISGSPKLKDSVNAVNKDNRNNSGNKKQAKEKELLKKVSVSKSNKSNDIVSAKNSTDKQIKGTDNQNLTRRVTRASQNQGHDDALPIATKKLNHSKDLKGRNSPVKRKHSLNSNEKGTENDDKFKTNMTKKAKKNSK